MRGKHVPVPQLRVRHLRARREVWFGVELPPLRSEVVKGLAPGIEETERAQPLTGAHLAVPRLRVSFSVE